jgi:alkylation response protein AidB-like acyl-CoA dehydrogenase
MHHPGLTVQPMPTIGDEITNSVFFDNVWIHDDYRVGQLGAGFSYISEALDLERFTMFTFSPIEQRFEELVEWLRTAKRDGEPLRASAHVRQKIATLATQLEVSRVLGLRFVAAATEVGGKPPTVEASEYKLYATSLSQRVANAMCDLAGPGAQLRVHTAEAPLRGRAEMSYRYSVIDTIGGGASEIQKNIIARRKLGLPKNF